MITFAIGDIHGCLPLLTKLVLLCQIRAIEDGHDDVRFICLGDYLDKGPYSAQTIDFLRSWQRDTVQEVILLKGNHEAMFVWSSKGEGHIRIETEQSIYASGLEIQEIADFVDALPVWFDDGVRLFVHAGIEPGIPLDQQNPDTCMWIRKEFHMATEMFDRYIVHGHTPTKPVGEPLTLHNRCNVDTAPAHENGALTAAVFVDGHVQPVGFIQARA